MTDYKDKIKKLLALAESNNEHEAKAALLKAKELMAQYKIEEYELVDAKDKKVKRIDTKFEYTKRGEWWMGGLSTIIAENYCCRSAVSRDYLGAQKRTVFFIGLEGDVDVCAKIFEYAVETARTCGQRYLKRLPQWNKLSFAEKNKVKNSYALGFARGVRDAFEEQRNARTTDESKWGLVMVVPKEVNDACSHFVADRYNGKHSIYNNVRDEGYAEGCRFNPNSRLEKGA